MKLSIVIPVYNVESFVAKCIKSCLMQDLDASDYEIIVVNDESPDNSMNVVRTIMDESKVAGQNCDIRIINRINGGLSAARNTGLSEARGEYVWFVDSDDWIEPYVLGKLIKEVYKNNLDVLCFNLQLVFPDAHVERYSIHFEEYGRIYNGPDFVCRVDMPPAAWCAIYRKDFLNSHELRFYEGILHEDQEFTPRAYCLARRISYINEVIYNYNQREGSIMKSRQSERKCVSLLTVADSLFDFVQHNKKELCQEASWAMMNHISFVFSQSLANYSKAFFQLDEYKQKPYYPLSINPLLNLKTRWKYRLINLSLDLYLKVYRLI